MDTIFRVAGYLRLSVEDDDKDISDSILSQKSIIEKKIRELGKEFELIDLYIDDGYTGLNTNRPSFQRMIKDIEGGKINTVITKDLSRLSRNSFEANYLIELYFLEKRVRYISILDNVDTYIKNSNNDMIQFKTLINDWYSKDISKKVKSGVKARKEKGLYLGAFAPYGYYKNPKNKNQLLVKEEEAEVVKIIFEMYDKGKTYKEIGTYLDNKNIPSPRRIKGQLKYNDDYKWVDKGIKFILENGMYLGNIYYGKRIKLSYKSDKVKYIPKKEWKVVYGTHEPIISNELFERVQRKIDTRKMVKPQKYEWLLNGIVYCKECGEKIILKVKNDKNGNLLSSKLSCSKGLKGKKYCVCGSKGIEEQTFTNLVIKSIESTMKRLLRKNKLEEKIKKEYENKNNEGFEKDITKIKSQIIRADKMVKSIYNDYKDGLLEEDDYKKFYKIEVEKRNTLKQKLQEVLVKQKNTSDTVSVEEIVKIIKDVSKIDSWDKERIRDIIYNIEIDNNNYIHINYRYNIFTKVQNNERI